MTDYPLSTVWVCDQCHYALYNGPADDGEERPEPLGLLGNVSVTPGLISSEHDAECATRADDYADCDRHCEEGTMPYGRPCVGCGDNQDGLDEDAHPATVWATEETQKYTRTFTNAYAEAMLWANTLGFLGDDEDWQDDVEPSWWQSPRVGWQLAAFDLQSQTSIEQDCTRFVEANWTDLADLDPEDCGHDFAFDRNGHGTGFWDRNLGERGERLSDNAREYGDTHAYYDARDDAEDTSVYLG